jgi:peptidoglycan/xylan/chitin deacetylase (PgdA/CDA1 family)
MKAAKTAFYENVFANKQTLPANKPTISFTFDDAPLSALSSGAEILARAGFAGTYYLAGTFADASAHPGPRKFISTADARELRRGGHQIGCHTFSHRSLKSGSAHECAQDTARNRAFWQDALGEPLLDFSFPFGEMTVSGKRAIRDCYRTLRGNRRGINRGTVDVACLRAVSLYSDEFNRQEIENWITDCEANGGWLIFYTHGVADPAPERFDTTAEDFQWVVQRCQASSAKTLSVEKAREYLSISA